MGASTRGGMPRAIYADDDEGDTFDLRDERPLSRARRRLPWLRMTLFSGLCITALAYLAQHEGAEQPPSGPKAVPATVLTAPAPTWQVLNPANTVFSLDKTLGSAIVEARQLSGGGREDTLVAGAFGDPRYARVTFSHRIPTTPRSFYVDMVRRAADAGLAVERNGQTSMVATKFGAVESAELTLAGPAEQNCQAFRYRDDDAAFGFQGWLCGIGALPADVQRLTCFIDAMTISGGDQSLVALFARANRSRPESCPETARTALIGTKPLRALTGPSVSAFR